MKRYINYLTAILIIIVFLGITLPSINPTQMYDNDSLYQVSKLNILANGDYLGNVTVRELKSHGNTGIGTFNYMDGEMVETNGVVYQIKSSGKIIRASDDTKVPFAMVTNLKSFDSFKIGSANYIDFQDILNPHIKNKTAFYVIKVPATFNYIKVRSVPAQTELNHKLSDIIQNQTIFYKTNVTGTLIGFWCPVNCSSINQPGFHLHFISTDEKTGGHVLDFSLKKGFVKLDQIESVTVVSKDT